MKFQKDGRTTVRYSTELFEPLKEQGWTVQELMDWAIQQKTQIKVEVSPVQKKKKKKESKK